jgi:ribonuclease HI
VLWTCEAAKDVWSACRIRIQKCAAMEVDFISLFLHLWQKLEADDLQRMVLVARQIWLRRNKVVFGGEFLAPAFIVGLADSQLENHKKAVQGRRVGELRQLVQRGVLWKPPDEGTIKINWDAALDRNRKKMGFGIVVRNFEGRVLAARCGSVANISDPLIAEAIGAWKSVELCQNLGLSKIFLEGDNLEVVSALQKEGPRWKNFGMAVNDSKALLLSFISWKVGHIKREGNVVAHKLAKMGLICNVVHLWREGFPSCIHDAVFADNCHF